MNTTHIGTPNDFLHNGLLYAEVLIDSLTAEIEELQSKHDELARRADYLEHQIDNQMKINDMIVDIVEKEINKLTKATTTDAQ